jgi:hypothetical protein
VPIKGVNESLAREIDAMDGGMDERMNAYR